MLLQETSLNFNNKFHIVDYDCHWNDRDIALNGQASVRTTSFIKRSLSYFFNVLTPLLNFIEATLIFLNIPNKKPVISDSIYIASASNSAFSVFIWKP
ncbi:hypothetical protein CEXT_788891 [Caerostris extrusa]|uniref:Uncharacterized protein n=1 Tax=Caerostris extrusa TaxID=172846 RepID=A0AAV4S188_CAEEX|nr:hypothetical protein CEXT_788891 [Caerostris extrusa]